MITSDFHMHTSFSTDSKAPMESVIRKCIDLGLKDIAVTDHMDYDFPADACDEYEGNFTYDIDAHLAEFTRLKEIYGKQINMYYGSELGFADTATDYYNKLLAKYPLDFAIGSLHIVDNMDPYFPKYWSSYATERIGLERYLTRIIESQKLFKNYDSLGHCDYIFRVAPEHKAYEYSEYADYFDTILKTLIAEGKALEVNTAGYKYKLGVPNPRPCVLKRYKELGGELITVGSDGHAPEQLAYDYAKCDALLKELGYKYVFIYKEHKPIAYTI